MEDEVDRRWRASPIDHVGRPDHDPLGVGGNIFIRQKGTAPVLVTGQFDELECGTFFIITMGKEFGITCDLGRSGHSALSWDEKIEGTIDRMIWLTHRV